MTHTRRHFLKVFLAGTTVLTGLLRPVLGLAARNREAFSADSEADALAAFFPGETITHSNAIEIDVHSLVENGAVVPVKINSELPTVRSITILVEKNPNPLIASFNLSPECKAFIATRIKMDQPSDIVAVVRSEHKLFSARKFVEVVEGGCG